MPTSVNIKAKKTDNQSLIDAILDSRGVKDKYEFLHPLEFPLSSPFIFSDMKKSVEIINNAILNKEKILVWGDFDSDGITSSAILYKTLKFLGADFDVFLPDRINLGHGLNSKELINQKVKNKIKVLITVDCGITNNKEISLMKGLGVKTIVTDHHRPQGDLPNADCIINPMAPNSFCLDLSISDIEKNSYLSGAGVALKLAYALLGDNDNQIKKNF